MSDMEVGVYLNSGWSDIDSAVLKMMIPAHLKMSTLLILPIRNVPFVGSLRLNFDLLSKNQRGMCQVYCVTVIHKFTEETSVLIHNYSRGDTYPDDFRPMWVPGHCRMNPPRFLAECRKRRLNQGSYVLVYFRLSALFDGPFHQ